MKKIILLSLILTFNLFSQTHPTIRTGRPGQSIGPFVLGTKIFQLQSGIEKSHFKNNTTHSTFLINNNVLRYGLNEKFEISGVFDLREDKNRNNIITKQNGMDNQQLGFRINLIDKSDGFIPALGFQTRFRFEGSGDYERNRVSPIIILATMNRTSQNSSLITNWGFTQNGNDFVSQYNYSISYSYSLSEKWGTFIEHYGRERDSTTLSAWDVGVSYLLNSNTQFDTSFGNDLESGFNEHFISLGISWRTL